MPDTAASAQVEPLELLMKRLQERGDLPIIRRNAAHILRASENSESGASDVARIILHDTGQVIFPTGSQRTSFRVKPLPRT